jgi:electron transfer flavoprotein alpha subunit
MPGYQGVLVNGEVIAGGISTMTRELLNMGKKLSHELSQPLSTSLIGGEQAEIAKEIIALGSDRVYLIHPSSSIGFHPEIHVAALTELVKRVAPSVILFGHTDIGRDVAPRLAVRLGTTITMDCTGLHIDAETKQLLQSKPVYGGNAVAVWVSKAEGLQIVTLRPKAVRPAEPDPSRNGEIIEMNITIDESSLRSRLVETVKRETQGIRLDDAKVVIAGGGGIGSRDGFKILEELAEVLGGTVGVTRVPCDEGWMPTRLEIGQTGHIVTPNLYIAIGISGASQHMAGCSGSKCIVSINRDPEATIFKESDFGIVGDYREVLPAFIEKCRKLVK